MGVSGWVFLLVPAYPGSHGPRAAKRLRVCYSVWRLLLQAGMDVNQQSSRGSSLHEAATFARPDVVRLLLSVSYSSQVSPFRATDVVAAAAVAASAVQLDSV